ncbi:N-acetylglucosamine-1-phosphodiester alpha-N-acetylglucosaminidase [Thecamonas trahens ATCC 50062]|uniref:N-acetylglucosamine-1-phosphodiester alpha-N-acetylglucosaminidase n=1 Tax=Thecamonas trahens ATCC 50062 TaxID=461836 RepID=A0A0L0D3L0_THETB|nr:N-acetylglucosamine-1-phosphodiester alpha-N-acetylglucosaminidase [Thecamonas trahens ATCC 50062]KNC46810.1 N-acetylglucosamine-1-phosphodiester alpha-N-acetylglucosaminidase [Thecamonas trahens ATCC 50062]|eukprot:XP_013760085.1 N-acetylglucosamine-1-phosphodiester alpha-N-acetylglucosaminidase [Thecamonas trahens ATCC 50062]
MHTLALVTLLVAVVVATVTGYPGAASQPFGHTRGRAHDKTIDGGSGHGLPNVTHALAGGGSGSRKAQFVHTFVNRSLDGVRYTGHLLVLDNPSPGTFALLPPYPGGCGTKAYTTSTAAAGRCLAATNAGFFDVATGACLGSLVSDGKVVQASTLVRPSFGMLAANAHRTHPVFFAGYVAATTETELASAGFVNLVSGVGWLVANGTSFLNASIAIEHPSPSFVAEAAPRLAIGHDADGRLMILEVDGDEIFKTGPNLVQLTALALDLGFYNAVNLDGGGSDTVVLGSSICSSCGALNQTCTDIKASATPTMPAASAPPTPAGEYMPCIKCGYAAGHNLHIPLCQRLVTSITCIRDTPDEILTTP